MELLFENEYFLLLPIIIMAYTTYDNCLRRWYDIGINGLQRTYTATFFSHKYVLLLLLSRSNIQN